MKYCFSFLIKIACIPLIMSLVACGGSGGGSNPNIAGISGPNVQVVNGMIVMSLVFQNVTVDAGATIPIPKYPNSTLQIGPDFQSNGTLFSLTINAADYLGNVGTGLDPHSLPGGRALPGVTNGVLPSVSFQIRQLMNTTFYVGPDVVGFFVPHNVDTSGAIISFRFFDNTSKPVGTLSLVGADPQGQYSGVLLLLSPALLGIKGGAAQVEALKYYSKIY